MERKTNCSCLASNYIIAILAKWRNFIWALQYGYWKSSYSVNEFEEDIGSWTDPINNWDYSLKIFWSLAEIWFTLTGCEVCLALQIAKWQHSYTLSYLEDACHRARNLCNFSGVQKGTLGLTLKGCVLQRVSLDALSDIMAVLGMRQSIGIWIGLLFKDELV